MQRFLRASTHFAVAAMATHNSEPALPMLEPQKPGRSSAARKLVTEAPGDGPGSPAVPEHSSAAEGSLEEAADAAQATENPKTCSRPKDDAGEEAEESCQLFRRRPLADPLQVPLAALVFAVGTWQLAHFSQRICFVCVGKLCV